MQRTIRIGTTYRKAIEATNNVKCSKGNNYEEW